MVVFSKEGWIWEETGPAISTVDPADIRGLVTTVLVSVGRLPHSRHEGRCEPPLNVLEGCANPGPRLLPEVEVSSLSSDSFRSLSGDGHLLSDRPHEREDLPGDGRHDDVWVLAAGGEAPEPFAEPDLRFPGDFLDGLRLMVESLSDDLGDLRRVAVGPGALDKNMPDMGIAALGDPSEPAALPGGVF